LENLYLGSSLELVHAVREFQQTVSEGCHSVHKHCYGGSNRPPAFRSDQHIRFQILGNLLPEYEPLVPTLTHVSGRSDLKHLKEAILAYEKKLATRKSGG